MKVEKKEENKTSKKQPDSENVVLRAIVMVVLNSLCSLTMKFPMTINTILEFTYEVLSMQLTTITDLPNEGKNFFLLFCNEYGFLEMFEAMSNFFYFLSIFLNLIFYIFFDKKFYASFVRLFVKDVTPKQAAKAKAAAAAAAAKKTKAKPSLQSLLALAKNESQSQLAIFNESHESCCLEKIY